MRYQGTVTPNFRPSNKDSFFDKFLLAFLSDDLKLGSEFGMTLPERNRMPRCSRLTCCLDVFHGQHAVVAELLPGVAVPIADADLAELVGSVDGAELRVEVVHRMPVEQLRPGRILRAARLRPPVRPQRHQLQRSRQRRLRSGQPVGYTIQTLISR